jgi:hypothetical protein
MLLLWVVLLITAHAQTPSFVVQYWTNTTDCTGDVSLTVSAVLPNLCYGDVPISGFAVICSTPVRGSGGINTTVCKDYACPNGNACNCGVTGVCSFAYCSGDALSTGTYTAAAAVMGSCPGPCYLETNYPNFTFSWEICISGASIVTHHYGVFLFVFALLMILF